RQIAQRRRYGFGRHLEVVGDEVHDRRWRLVEQIHRRHRLGWVARSRAPRLHEHERQRETGHRDREDRQREVRIVLHPAGTLANRRDLVIRFSRSGAPSPTAGPGASREAARWNDCDMSPEEIDTFASTLWSARIERRTLDLDATESRLGGVDDLA